MGSMYDIYRVEVVQSWPDPQGGKGYSIVTAIFLFDEEEKGVRWMTEEGRSRFIGTGQGKWFVLGSSKAVILQDEAGYMPIARLEYQKFPWRKGDMGKMSYYGPGTTKPLEFEYRVTPVQ